MPCQVCQEYREASNYRFKASADAAAMVKPPEPTEEDALKDKKAMEEKYASLKQAKSETMEEMT